MKGCVISMMKCDPRAFARCPYNKTCVSVEMAEFQENSDCHRFNNKVLDMPPTNADRIRGMDDRELAYFLTAITRSCADRRCDNCPIGNPSCIAMIHWIKQEA